MTTAPEMRAVVACADLLNRSGGKKFTIGWDCPHDEDDKDHSCSQTTWWAQASWNGHRLAADGHPHPNGAAMNLAVKVLDGATCRCQKPVWLGDGPGPADGCLWSMGWDRWEPGCDSPPVAMPARTRGDLRAMHRQIKRRRR